METTFYDLPFTLAPGRVFSPRPATERLVRAALDRIDGGERRGAGGGARRGARPEGAPLPPVRVPVDVVVATPPSLPDSLHDAAYDEEPDDAVCAPGDGLEPYR